MKKRILSIVSVLLAVLLPATALATPDNPAKPRYELSTTTSAPATVYQPGCYEAGVDIPVGEYIMLSLGNADVSSYQIYENRGPGDSNALVEHCNFEYNVILTLKEGYILTFTNCTASPLHEVPQIDHRLGQGYKAGFHIPAGTYRLKTTGYRYVVYYIDPYPSEDSIPRRMPDYAFLSGDSYVTVADGDYLLLVGCILEEYLGSANPPTDGLPFPEGYDSASAYQPGFYQVGIDIPAGEYVLFMKPDRTQGQASQYQIQLLDEYLKQSNEVTEVYLAEIYEDTPLRIQLENGDIFTMSNYLAFPANR